MQRFANNQPIEFSRFLTGHLVNVITSAIAIGVNDAYGPIASLDILLSIMDERKSRSTKGIPHVAGYTIFHILNLAPQQLIFFDVFFSHVRSLISFFKQKALTVLLRGPQAQFRPTVTRPIDPIELRVDPFIPRYRLMNKHHHACFAFLFGSINLCWMGRGPVLCRGRPGRLLLGR